MDFSIQFVKSPKAPRPNRFGVSGGALPSPSESAILVFVSVKPYTPFLWWQV